ncbi:Uncharacterised protein [Nocardia brasiliensis]|nr:Uncharacterised protein [Nocardia brasiliensis]
MSKSTVVLVHGAFADAYSTWHTIAGVLIQRGHPSSPPPTRCAACTTTPSTCAPSWPRPPARSPW